jgi:cellulose synthase/poly-beta-1,6-N-acetylglucosamine synthase-like glycosyltransferase
MEELENKPKYKVAYIPDPLCWTEAPDNYKTFTSQRNRWTRGTIETLRKHRKLVLIEMHGAMGVLSYPYWFCLKEWSDNRAAGSVLF